MLNCAPAACRATTPLATARLNRHAVVVSMAVAVCLRVQGGPKKLRQIFLAITLVNMDRF